MTEFMEALPRWIVKMDDGSFNFSRREDKHDAMTEFDDGHIAGIVVRPFPVPEDPMMRSLIHSLIELTLMRKDGGLTGWLLGQFAPVVTQLMLDN